MLHFANAALLAILHDALEMRRDELTQFIDASASNEEWEAWSPTLATHFSPEVVVDVIDRLLDESRVGEAGSLSAGVTDFVLQRRVDWATQFKPRPQDERKVHTMLDQLIAWGRDPKTLRVASREGAEASS